jgi:plasmid stabilization system protein ParE
MVFRVSVSPQARNDASGILEWLLEQHAGDVGLRWFFKLTEAVRSLSNLPGRCKLAHENGSLPFEMRQLLYGHKPRPH